MQTLGRDTQCSKVRYLYSLSVCRDLLLIVFTCFKILLFTHFPHIQPVSSFTTDISTVPKLT